MIFLFNPLMYSTCLMQLKNKMVALIQNTRNMSCDASLYYL